VPVPEDSMHFNASLALQNESQPIQNPTAVLARVLAANSCAAGIPGRASNEEITSNFMALPAKVLARSWSRASR